MKINFEQENVLLFIFDINRKLIYKEIIFKGRRDYATVDQKILFSTILRVKECDGFIIAHNHTTLSLLPSPDDYEFTESIKMCSELLELNFYDHIIFNRNNFLSMKSEGLI